MKRLFLITESIILLIFCFLYKHLISYKLAASHTEVEGIYPIFATIVSLLAILILAIISIKHENFRFVFYVFLIIFVASIICVIGASTSHCPTCYEPDFVYRFLTQ